MSAGEASEFEARVGHAFRDPELLLEALTHASYLDGTSASVSNERLEYLGDAVLDLVVSERLLEAHPDWAEGALTRARASLVRGERLAERAREIGLPALLRLGNTEVQSQGADKDSILANAYEAVVGALYLDGGLEPVQRLIAGWFEAEDPVSASRDAKTSFQEWAHASLRETPRYHTVADSGVDDDDLRFTVEVRVANEPWGSGRGRSKRLAERAAAEAALARAEAP